MSKFSKIGTTMKCPGETLSAEELIAQLEDLQRRIPEPQFMLVCPDGKVLAGPDPFKLVVASGYDPLRINLMGTTPLKF